VLPFVCIKLRGVNQNSLIDSGANVCIISRSLVNSLGLVIKTQVGRIKLADNQFAYIVGCVNVPIEMAGVKCTHRFYVLEEAPTVILGTDFMDRHGIILDIQGRKVMFKNHPTLWMDLVVGNSESLSKEIERNLVFNLQLWEETEHERIEGLISEFPDVICDKIGRTNLVEYSIEYEGTSTVRQRAYKTSPWKAKLIREEVQKLLDMGLIRESNSQFSSPVLLAPKAEGGQRLVIDFRAINKFSKR